MPSKKIASAERLIITVEAPSGRHDLNVPKYARIADLLPAIVEACGGRSDATGWSIRPRGEKVLSGDQTLGDAGIFSGAVLELIEPAATAAADPRVREPRITAMSAGDYVRFLDQAIAGREISRSVVVAVMANHPGAGTTTIAALLATLLGQLRSDAVAVADANPESGALSHWLAPDAQRPAFIGELSPHEVMGAMVGIGGTSSVLPAPSGQADWPMVIGQLRRLSKIVVLDCAAGFRKPSSAAGLAAADLVVVVTRRGQHESMPRGHPIVVVENQSPRRRRAAPSGSGYQVVNVVDEPAAADRLKTRGFSWSVAPPSWQESIRELAAVLVGSAS